jgi:hypothetical protein
MQESQGHVAMRRLVVELYGPELNNLTKRSSFHNIESLELVHLLRYDRNEFAGIWRIKLRNPNSKIKDSFKYDDLATEVQLLEREEDSSFIIFMRRRPRHGLLSGFNITSTGGGYLFGPFEFKNDRIRITFVGSQRNAKNILGQLEKRGLSYKVVSLTDADFAPDSLLNRLTEKQRNTLISAYKLGYYDVPRKINSEKLANHLNLRGATVVEHLRKAEHRLVSGILSES